MSIFRKTIPVAKRYDTLRNHFTYSFYQTGGANPRSVVPPCHGAD